MISLRDMGHTVCQKTLGLLNIFFEDSDPQLLLGHPVGEPAAYSQHLLDVVRYARRQRYHPEGIFQAWSRGEEGYILFVGDDLQEKRLAWIAMPNRPLPHDQFQLFIPEQGLPLQTPPKIYEEHRGFRHASSLNLEFSNSQLEEAIEYALAQQFHPEKIEQTIGDGSNGHIRLRYSPTVEGFITSERASQHISYHVYFPR